MKLHLDGTVRRGGQNSRISEAGFARAAHTSRKRLTLRGRLRRVLLDLFVKQTE
jgi:hypothetical protein